MEKKNLVLTEYKIKGIKTTEAAESLNQWKSSLIAVP